MLSHRSATETESVHKKFIKWQKTSTRKPKYTLTSLFSDAFGCLMLSDECIMIVIALKYSSQIQFNESNGRTPLACHTAKFIR